MSKRRKVNIGDVFGKLTVIDIKLETRGNGHPRNYAVCDCQCGNSIVLLPKFLLDGHTTSCRCDKPRVITGKRVKTGESKDRLYSIWYTMISRCYNKNDYSYIKYGATGITVYEEWRNDYFMFKSWSLNNGYKNELSIDRIDNDKGYYPENGWPPEDALTKPRTGKHLAFGQVLTIFEHAERGMCVVNKYTLRTRIHKGWNIEEAMTTPLYGKVKTHNE